MLVIKDKIMLLYFTIILILFLPEGLIVNLGISSISYGAFISYIITLVFLQNKLFPKLKLKKNFFKFFKLVFFITVSSLLTGFFTNNNFDLSRYILSLLLLIIMVHTAYLLANRFNELNNYELNKLIKRVAITLICLTPISLLNWYILNGVLTPGVVSRKMIFFTEPSHYAFISSPFFIYYLLSSNKKKTLIFSFILLFSAILLSNLTLLVPLIIALFVKNKKLLINLTVLLVLITPYFAIYQETLNSKVLGLFDSDTRSLTVLVYQQGWQYIVSSFEMFMGAGTGFQQLGQVRLNSSAQSILESMNYPLNQNDGSFLFSKLTVEFGIIGIVLTFLYLKKLVQIVYNFSIYKNSFYYLFIVSVYLSFFIILFVRNSSYFNSTILFFIMSMFSMGFGKFKTNTKLV